MNDDDPTRTIRFEMYTFVSKRTFKILRSVRLFGSPEVEPLLGVTALESAGFEVDPVRQALRPLRKKL